MNKIDHTKNKSPFSFKNKLGRIIWNVVYLFFFRTSPVFFLNKYRIVLLRIFGARIGNGSIIYPSCRIWAPWNLVLGEHSCIGPHADIYSMDKISIGNNATISQNSFLCTGTHDAGSESMKLITKPIIIEDGAWICAHAKVLPGVTVKEGCIVGMDSVLTKDTTPWTIYSGNPAAPRKKRIIERE